MDGIGERKIFWKILKIWEEREIFQIRNKLGRQTEKGIMGVEDISRKEASKFSCLLLATGRQMFHGSR